VWSSGDGEHWGELLSPHAAAGTVGQIGLYCKRSTAARSITLRQLRVCELDALTSVAPLPLQERASALSPPPGEEVLADVGDWEQWVRENQPADADAAAWRRACALVLLHATKDSALVSVVLDGLLRESLETSEPLDTKLDILEDAALVWPWHTSHDVDRFVGHFYSLGHQLVRRGDLAGFDSVRHALMRVPRFRPGGRIEALDPSLLRQVLAARTIDGRWDDAARLCRQLRFWAEQPAAGRPWSGQQAPLRGLVDWAEASAASRIPQLELRDGLVPDPRWRPPVDIATDKDAENTLLEMTLALRDRAWRTACQLLIGSTVPPRALVSDPDDEQRFASFSTILADTMQKNPALVRNMGEAVGAAELMRLGRAQAGGDAAVVEAATVQYYGTPAAAEALAWLGDQRLARGEFTLATMYYERATTVADPAGRGQLDARLRLAAAMQGRTRGRPITEAVRFGDEEMSPAEFEELVAEMLDAHPAADGPSSPNPMRPAAELPAPAQLTVRSWGELDGSQGTHPEQVPGVSQHVDWSGRQYAVLTTGDALIVSNRFHVAAFDLQTGARRWTYDSGERQGATHAWPLVPMRPLVVGDRLYTRLIPKDGRPELVCVDMKTGNRAWNTTYPGAVAGDPMLVRDRLLAVCEPNLPDEPMAHLTLASFHLSTGATLDEVPLVTLSPEWHGRHVCQSTLSQDRMVAVVAGTVICVDTAGQVHWIRRNTWFPIPLDPSWGRQLMQPPLVEGDRVVATQPGAPSIDCLDLNTGRLYWRRPAARLRRLLGIVDRMLVVSTDDGLAALSLDHGEQQWYRPVPDLLEGATMGAAGRLCYARRVGGDASPQATMEWLDGRTGRLLGRQALWAAGPTHVLVGPLAADGPRLWCLTGVVDERGRPTPRRRLLELVPAGVAPSVPEPSEGWNPDVPPELRAAADLVLPGWTLLSGHADQNTGLQAELGGRKNVLVTRADKTPLRFARLFHISDEDKPQLVLDFAHDPRSQSCIEVRAAGLPVWQHFTPPASGAGAAPESTATWTRQTLDLSEYAGRTVGITVRQTAVGGGPAYTWWQGIDLQR
jgi:outer membrane protein assembly factor BamB